MNFTVIDTGALLLAIVCSFVVVVAPGYALARLFGWPRAGECAPLVGVVVGLAILPGLDSLAVRFFGLEIALALNLGGAAAAVFMFLRRGDAWRPSRIGLLLAACWLILLTLEWVDYDVAGKLYQPLTIFDAVKHAATAQAIFDSGAPPRDAFFLRPDRASYYYFFYTLAALVMRLSGRLCDAKAAVGGVAFWTGLGVYGLVRLTMARAGLVIAHRRAPILIVAILAAGGLDVIAMLVFAWSRHYWIAEPLLWNEQVGAWLEDLLWVPHHVTALIAGMVGVMALSEGVAGIEGRHKGIAARMAALAGLALAATLGLSVWVMLGFAVTIGVWGAALLVERRWRAVALVAVAGGFAMLLALPQMLDLKTGRAGGGGVPVALTVRTFTPVGLLLPTQIQLPVALLTLPLNYAFEFGVLSLGSFLFWRGSPRRTSADAGEFSRVLIIAAIVGLVVGGFLRSTLFNNDLGWRVMLLPLLAATVWTIVAFDGLLTPGLAWTGARRIGASAFCVLLGLGWGTVLYATVMMRAYPFVTVNPSARFIGADPATARGLREAFGWAASHLATSAVVQQNPTFTRAFAFGVYGRQQIGVADLCASLYGADPAAVAARVEALGPIFQHDLPLTEIGARARANGVDDLIVTAADPVWARPASFVWRATPLFASARVRIFPVVTLEAAK